MPLKEVIEYIIIKNNATGYSISVNAEVFRNKPQSYPGFHEVTDLDEVSEEWVDTKLPKPQGSEKLPAKKKKKTVPAVSKPETNPETSETDLKPKPGGES